MKHTPAPWTYVGNVDHRHVQKSQLVLQASRTNAKNIASVIPCAGMTGEEVEANARLIAAAPDMLRALVAAEKVVDQFAFMVYEGEGIQALVKSAIEKATAQQVL